MTTNPTRPTGGSMTHHLTIRRRPDMLSRRPWHTSCVCGWQWHSLWHQLALRMAIGHLQHHRKLGR